MSDKYILPRIDFIEPREILQSIRRIEKFKAYKEDIELNMKPPKDRFDECYKRLLDGEELTTKDFKILSYYIEKIVKENNFHKYYNAINTRIYKFLTYRGFIRPFLSYIYNYYNEDISKDNIDKIYKLFKICLNELKLKQKYETLCEFNNGKSNVIQYLKETKIKLSNFNTIDEIKDVANKLFIKFNDKYYFELMVGYIIKNHKDSSSFKEFKKMVLLMDLNQKKEVFKGIISFYLNERTIENYPKNWFALAGEVLGDPYKRTNYNWDGLGEDIKDTYRRWRNGHELYEFFSKIAKETDGERFNFWKNYIDCIYRIKYYSQIKNALIMEFSDHVFVEFAQTGNALYIYRKEHYNIDYIEDYIRRSGSNIKIEDLKRADLSEKKLSHNHYWQGRFEKELRQRGYYMSR